MGKYDFLTREELIDLLEKTERNETLKLQDRLDGEKRIAEALMLMLKNYNSNYEKDILRIVLERYQADRASLFKFDWEQQTNSNILEVTSKGTPSVIRKLQELPNDGLADFLEQFRQGHPLVINEVDLMPETSYQGPKKITQIFQILNLKSAILFPMHIFGKLWGYINMATVREYKTWNEDDIEWLKAFTDILSIGVSQRFFRVKASTNERRFGELFRNMPIGYVRHKIICNTHNQPVDYEYLETNPAFEQLTGINRNQCIGKTAKQLVNHLDHNLFKIYQQVAFEEKQIQIDYYAQGLNKWFYSVLYSPKKGEFISLFYDITDRMKASEQIKQNEKKVRIILENLPVGVISFDHCGHFLDCNEAASQTFTCLKDPTYDKDLKLNAEQIEELNIKKILSQDFTLDIVKQKKITLHNNSIPEGAIYLSTKIIKYTDENDECLGYLFIGIDNTAIKQTNLELNSTQKALTENLVRQSLILETGQIYPWYMNAETQEVDLSEDFYKTFNEKKADHTPFSLSDFIKNIHPEDRELFQQEYHKLEKEETQRIKIEIRLNIFKYGYQWCEINATIETRREAKHPQKWLGFLTIIQQRKDNEQQLIEALKKAEESDKLKSSFLANVSHEIRTPLNAIVGFSELIANAEDKTEKDYYLDIVKTNNNLLLNLINDILDLSKIESGRIDLKETSVDVRGICQELCEVHQLRAQPGVKVIFEQTDQPLIMRTDRNRLTQLYSNLINNAIKNTSKGTITVGYHHKRQYVECYVRDTGKGIPKEKQALIFNRFEKLNSNIQGFGLGLSICKSILEKMNGTIRLSSKEGKGSEFRFTLPYKAPEKQRNRTPEINSLPKLSECTNPTILIAEDIDSNYELLKANLGKKYKLVRARTGIEAINLFTRENPALILMDLQMPELTGIEAAQIIREVSPEIPIIALIAYAYDSDKEIALEAGCNDFMTKPIHSGQLKAILKKYLI